MKIKDLMLEEISTNLKNGVFREIDRFSKSMKSWSSSLDNIETDDFNSIINECESFIVFMRKVQNKWK